MNTTRVSTGAGISSRHPRVIGYRRFCHSFNKDFSKQIALGLAMTLLFAGCASPALIPMEARAPSEAESQVLRTGDVVKIAFPRTPTLDTVQQIRRDGKLNLYLVGEVQAANLSPGELEAELLKLYSSQLVSKEVRVTVVSSSFAVFVTGAVVRPGKLTPDRALTAFEAIMEAGGFDNGKADTKAVTVIRHEKGQTKNFRLNLKAVLDGKPADPFYLQAFDIVYVPEKFSWF
jgi:polysaccharide biosynthesis/export protein